MILSLKWMLLTEAVIEGAMAAEAAAAAVMDKVTTQMVHVEQHVQKSI
jgi:hypothetical protein